MSVGNIGSIAGSVASAPFGTASTTPTPLVVGEASVAGVAAASGPFEHQAPLFDLHAAQALAKAVRDSEFERRLKQLRFTSLERIRRSIEKRSTECVIEIPMGPEDTGSSSIGSNSSNGSFYGLTARVSEALFAFLHQELGYTVQRSQSLVSHCLTITWLLPNNTTLLLPKITNSSHSSNSGPGSGAAGANATVSSLTPSSLMMMAELEIKCKEFQEAPQAELAAKYPDLTLPIFSVHHARLFELKTRYRNIDVTVHATLQHCSERIRDCIQKKMTSLQYAISFPDKNTLGPEFEKERMAVYEEVVRQLRQRGFTIGEMIPSLARFCVSGWVSSKSEPLPSPSPIPTPTTSVSCTNNSNNNTSVGGSVGGCSTAASTPSSTAIPAENTKANVGVSGNSVAADGGPENSKSASSVASAASVASTGPPTPPSASLPSGSGLGPQQSSSWIPIPEPRRQLWNNGNPTPITKASTPSAADLLDEYARAIIQHTQLRVLLSQHAAETRSGPTIGTGPIDNDDPYQKGILQEMQTLEVLISTLRQQICCLVPSSSA